jgi:hypothetical protein
LERARFVVLLGIRQAFLCLGNGLERVPVFTNVAQILGPLESCPPSAVRVIADDPRRRSTIEALGVRLITPAATLLSSKETIAQPATLLQPVLLLRRLESACLLLQRVDEALLRHH